MVRLLPVLLVFGAFAGCRCQPAVAQTPGGPASVAPTLLAFPDTFVGGRRVMTVEVRNAFRPARSLALAFPPPFSGPAQLELAGGEAALLEVAFAPTSPGAAAGTLLVDETSVTLTGQGLAPLDCGRAACEERRFAPETGTCERAVLPDGTSCSLSCLTAGQCAQGACVGTLSNDCDSHDACIIDACGADGCVHVPRECPVADPCQAVYCDPVRGCLSQNVEDGLPCGRDTCETATLCLAGRCETRPRPNGLDDCRYVDLASSDESTCAVTRSGRLRCWGANQGDRFGRGYGAVLAGPDETPGVLDATHVASAPFSLTWVARPNGEAQRLGLPLAVTLPAAEGLAVGGSQLCGLEQGAVRCRDTSLAGLADGGVLVAAQGASALSMMKPIASATPPELCVIADGGVACGAPAALAPVSLPGAATAVTAIEHARGCAVVAAAVHCWAPDAGPAAPWDGGVTSLASRVYDFPGDPLEGKVCAIASGAIECAQYQDGCSCAHPGPPRRVPGSEALGPLSQLSLGRWHGCARLEDGRVACWGANSVGQLGDRSPQPRGLQQLPLSATSMSAAPWGPWRFVASDGGAVTLTTQTHQDGGLTWRAAALAPTPAASAGPDGACERHATGAIVCGGVGPLPLSEVPTAYVDQLHTVVSPGQVSGFPGVCTADAAGAVRCWYQSQDAGVELSSHGGDAGGALVELTCANTQCRGTCAVRADGELRCFDADPPPPAGLPPARQYCGGDDAANGCVVGTGGALWCWGPWVGSPGAPVAAPGAWPLVREVRCGSHHVCALSGSNIVQCWGQNLWGQLGREGPDSTQAVTVPMPEPVRRLGAKGRASCALLQSGRVLCWGDNQHGLLGVPALVHSERPLLVVD